MSNWNIHTPDGFNDSLPALCEAKRRLETELRSLFSKAAYREISTPGFEFCDVYTSGDGFADSEQLYKTFDHRGRVLTARFDGTVPVARMVATKMADEPLPIRLFYIDEMYRYTPAKDLQDKEITQAGLELIGSDSPGADGEIIAMAIRAAEACGIVDLNVAVGQVDFFKGMVEEWDLSEEAASRLKHILDVKAIIAIESFCDEYRLSKVAREVLTIMLDENGALEQVGQLEQLVNNGRSRAALANLRDILSYLDDLDLLSYVTVDLGMLQSLNYYTGMMFKGYTYALGSPLFSGGRYDRVTSAFGRELPATGFSIGVDLALNAALRQGRAVAVERELILVAYAKGCRREALRMVRERRSAGEVVELVCSPISRAEAESCQAKRKSCHLVYVDGEAIGASASETVVASAEVPVAGSVHDPDARG